MANAGSVTNVHKTNRYGPYDIQLWKATVTVPAAATGVTVTAPSKMSGTAVAAWIDPTTLTASATIKVYDATDAMSTPEYVVDYTVPSPAVETHDALNARLRVMGTLTCVVASATAEDSFVLYVIVDPNADDALNVNLGDVSVDLDTDTIALMRCPSTAFYANGTYAAAQTNTSLKAAAGAGVKLYITDLLVTNDSTAAITVALLDGSGGTSLIGTQKVAASGGFALHLRTALVLTANTALCLTTTGTSNFAVAVSGYTA